MKRLQRLILTNYTNVLTGKRTKINMDSCLSLFVNDPNSLWKCYQVSLFEKDMKINKIMVLKNQCKNYILFAPVHETVPLFHPISSERIVPLLSRNWKDFFPIQQMEKYQSLRFKYHHIHVCNATLRNDRLEELSERC